MKLKKKSPKAKRTAAKLDEIAARHIAAADNQSEAKAAYDASREALLEMLDSDPDAQPTPNGKILTGNKYCIGYTQTVPSPVINVENLLQLLTAKEKKKLITTSVTYAVDERKLVELLEKGRFTEEQQKQFMSTKSTPSKRAFVQPKGANEA